MEELKFDPKSLLALQFLESQELIKKGFVNGGSKMLQKIIQ